MSVLTFKGGVHPADGKKLTRNKAIDEYLPEKCEFAIPLGSILVHLRLHWSR